MTDADEIALEQLSAWMDGELSPDQTRFLLRRLEADPVLRARFERWQLASACLRGQAVRLQSPAVADGIAAALAAQQGASRQRGAWSAAAAVLALALMLPQWLSPDAGPALMPEALTSRPPALLAGDAGPQAPASALPAAAEASVAEFPLVLEPGRKPWPRSPLTPDPEALDAYLVRHSALAAQDGSAGLLPYVDAMANGQDEAPASDRERP